MYLKILYEPYPFNNELSKNIVSALLFGTFVAAFLIVFQPFGLSIYASQYKTIQLIGYGLVTTVVLLLNRGVFTVLFPTWYSKKTWTVGKNILFTLYVFFCIGLVNLIYSNLLGFLQLNLKGFILYQGITLAVGIIPVSISTFILYFRKLKIALEEAKLLNSSIRTPKETNSTIIDIPSKNKSENVKIIVEQLLAVSAVENYVEIIFEKDGLQKRMVRNTLKNVQACIDQFSFIEQCHRSHLVNLEKVNHFSGNAQGLTLSFNKELDVVIPVSRKFVSSIKSKLLKMT